MPYTYRYKTPQKVTKGRNWEKFEEKNQNKRGRSNDDYDDYPNSTKRGKNENSRQNENFRQNGETQGRSRASTYSEGYKFDKKSDKNMKNEVSFTIVDTSQTKS